MPNANAAAHTNQFRRHRFTVVAPNQHYTGATAERARLPESFAAEIGLHCEPLSREESIAAAKDLRDAREGCWRAILSNPRRGVEVLPPWLIGTDIEGRRAYDKASLNLRASPNARRSKRDHDHAGKALAAALLRADQAPGVLPSQRDDHGLDYARASVSRLARRDPSLRPWHAIVEQAFAKRAASLDFLETRNLRFVAAVARRYLSHPGAESLSLSDLIGYGVPGLRLACLRFDPDRGYAFSTYSVNWIRHCIGRAIADHGRLIRITSHTCDRLQKISAAQRRLAAEGKPVTEIAIAKATGMSAKLVRSSIEALATTQISSMEAPCLAMDGDETTTLRHSYRDDGPAQDEVVHAKENVSILADLMATLTPRERTVVAARFGLDDGHERLLVDIGRDVGVGRERVRQIEKDALLKMRAEAVARGLAGDWIGKSIMVRGRVSPRQVEMAIG